MPYIPNLNLWKKLANCFGAATQLRNANDALNALLPTQTGNSGKNLQTDGTNTSWQGGSKLTRLIADVTNATATFANLSDLSITLIAGRKYTGRLVLKCNNSTAAEGIQLDFNGGGATMTSFWAAAGVLASGGTDTVGTNISTSLSGVINYTLLTGETVIVVEVSMVVNAGGTFIPRVAEDSHTVGTLTVELGSYLHLDNSNN